MKSGELALSHVIPRQRGTSAVLGCIVLLISASLGQSAERPKEKGGIIERWERFKADLGKAIWESIPKLEREFIEQIEAPAMAIAKKGGANGGLARGGKGGHFRGAREPDQRLRRGALNATPFDRSLDSVRYASDSQGGSMFSSRQRSNAVWCKDGPRTAAQRSKALP